MLMVCEKHYSGRPIPRRQRDDRTWRVAPRIGTIPRDCALVLSSFLPARLPAKNIPSFFPQLRGPKSSFLLHPNLYFLLRPLWNSSWYIRIKYPKKREREIFCIILEKTGDSSLCGTPVFFRGGQKIPMYDFVYDYPGTIHRTWEFSLNLLPRILLLRDCFFYTILQELLKNPNGRTQQYLHAPDVSLLEEMLMQMKKMFTNNCVCVCLSDICFSFLCLHFCSHHAHFYSSKCVCVWERERQEMQNRKS